MADALSKDDVEALIDAESSADGAVVDAADDADTDDAAVEFNFHLPNLITKGQLRSLATLHEQFAEEVQSLLAPKLHANVALQLQSTDQQHYEEFIEGLPDVGHLVSIAMDPYPESTVVAMDIALVASMFDLMLGGDGAPTDNAGVLTDVEMAVVNPLITQMIDALQTAWNNIAKIQLRGIGHESNPTFLRALGDNTPVVVIRCSVTVGSTDGTISLCYPLSIIQSILEHQSGHDTYEVTGEAASSSQQLLNTLHGVPLHTSVLLGEASLLASDLLRLSPGDVIVTDTKIGAPLDLYIEDIPLFQCRSGRMNKVIAVKLISNDDDCPDETTNPEPVEPPPPVDTPQ